MRLTFYGAAQEVTGSMHLVEVNGQRILLECGMFQGRREETYTRNLHFPFEPSSIHAVVLSHAHIDHSGNLPNLVKQGYTGNIWCTAATRNLSTYMLMDSGHIQEMDIEYVNQPGLGLATLRTPVVFKNMVSPDEDVPVRLVIMLALDQPKSQVEMLQQIAGLLQQPEVIVELMDAQTPEQVLMILEGLGAPT